MADFWRTWDQFRRKADAVKVADFMAVPARVVSIKKGETGYSEGFRWAVEVDKMPGKGE